jgi:YD repeat-containing protein
MASCLLKIFPFMKRTLLIVVALVGLMMPGLYAQQASAVIPPSPEAAALGKYGDVPVGEYTGTISPSVPLYEIKSRDITVPITADYFSRGIRVAEEASWIGLGWSLNAGGVITRTVMGRNDLLVAETNAGPGYVGFPFTTATSNCNADNSLNTNCTPSANYLQQVCQGMLDTEPDIFYFNFLGRSGKFVLRQRDRTFDAPVSIPSYNTNLVDGIPLSETKLRILFDLTLKQWEITDENGMKYYFKVAEKSETWYGGGRTSGDADAALQFNSASTDFITHSWFLTRILSPSGNKVDFIYDVDANGNTGYGSRSAINRSQSVIFLTKEIASNCAPMTYPITWTSVATYYSQVYLSQILFDGGSVSFYKSDRQDLKPATGFYSYNAPYLAQKLDRIEVNSAGKLIKKINFTYDYFNSTFAGANPELYKRLKLVSISESGIDAATQTTLYKGPYVFTYNQSVALPSKESMSQDFWGLYNGADNSINGLVPSGENTDAVSGYQFHYSGANRDANASYAAAGILTRMQYPMGGSTDFEYELNDYSQWGSGPVNYTSIKDDNQFKSWLFVASTDNSPVQVFKVDQAVFAQVDRSVTCWPPGQTPPACTASGFESLFYAVLTRINPDGTEAVVLNYQLGSDWKANQSVNPAFNTEVNPVLLQPGTYRMVVQTTGSFHTSLTVRYKTRLNSSNVPAAAVPFYGRQGGGLRIRRMVTRDGVSAANDKVTVYRYSQKGSGGYFSSGKLMMEPNHFAQANLENDFTVQCFGSWLVVYGNSESVRPMGSSAQGNFVGYDEVTILNGDNGEYGKVIKKFRNEVETAVSGNFFLMGLPNASHANSNGLLLEEKIYDRNNVTIQSTTHAYAVDRQKVIRGLKYQNYGKMLHYSSNIAYDVCYPGSMVYSYYILLSEFWHPLSTTQQMYDRTDPANQRYSTSTITYTFNTASHLQKTAEQSVDSKGHTLLTTYSYPGDASDPDRTSHPQMWDELNLKENCKFIFSPVIRRQSFDNSTLIYEEANSYVYDAAKDRIFYASKSLAPNGTVLENRLSFSYDYEPSLLVEVKKTNDVSTAYVYGYYNSLPVVKIENATYAQVKALISGADQSALAGLTTPAQISTMVNNLRASLPQALITSYTHDLLNGLSSVTDVNGKTTTYTYDALQRLMRIQDFEGQTTHQFKYQYKN